MVQRAMVWGGVGGVLALVVMVGEVQAQQVVPELPVTPSQVVAPSFRHRLEVSAVVGLPIVVGDVCEVDGDLVSCTGGSDIMPGGQLQLRWRFIENASVGLATGIAVNSEQPFPKEKDKDLGNGIWVWRTAFEPRAHLRPDPIVDLWIGGQVGWAHTFYEETSTGKNVTENSGGLLFGGSLGADFDVASRFALGLMVQVSTAAIADPAPSLQGDTTFHAIDDSNVWVDLGIRITTYLPL